jgi:enoyl-CoA hydratase
MVNGFCLGGGCEIALACDFIVAAEDAEFGQPEINLGIIPGWGGTQRLPRRVGVSKALEIILTGERINAKEAERIGLADRVVPRDKLEEAVLDLAKKIISKSPLAIKIAKSTTRKALETNLETGLLREAQAFAVCFSTEDAKEGLTAFRERRKPEFKGK